MYKMLSKWTGAIVINDVVYNSYEELERSNFDFKTLSDDCTIKLLNKNSNALKSSNTKRESEPISDIKQYKIKVKPYMTRKATPEFNFMEQYNNNVPMPLRVMVGEKIKETNGMVYMKLHGDIVARTIDTCMCCGKPIENKISRYFGMGPICGNHNYTNPFDSEEELNRAVEKYREQLRNIVWEGWIIKSAILEEE